MNKKKLLVLMLALSVASIGLVGCTKDKKDKPNDDIGVNDDAIEKEDEQDEQDEQDGGEVGSISFISEKYAEIKTEFGQDYVPSMELEIDDLADRTSINIENVEEFIAEVPMMSTHVDEFIAIKAKEGTADEVEEQLIAYKDYLQENSMNYPMNLDKVSAAKVVRVDDNIFFLMIGGFSDELEAETEESIEFARSEIQRAEDIIKK